jgi:5-methylcytosine-specific restriction protein B
MPFPETDRLFQALCQGNAFSPRDREEVTSLLEAVFKERCHSQDWRHFQARNALSTEAAWAGWIPADNSTSGAYQGTSFVWFPGEGGSVAVLCIGTGGFGPDAHILSRPGHRRRLQALARLSAGKLWVKPDFMDLQSELPRTILRKWPDIEAAARTYGGVMYAGCPVRDESTRESLEDLVDLFFHEHAVRLTGQAAERWQRRRSAMLASLLPRLTEDGVAAVLQERRFVILQGPPGTGKTRLGLRVAQRFGRPTQVQFHPARTYEDFVIGLAPEAEGKQLAFEVRAGDLLRANDQARREGKHVLFVDEVNRGDLARVLGEAIYLFEPGEPDREVDLPHEFDGERRLRLAPGLMVLGTRNTADRSIARIDLAIRRRFAFLDLWPDLEVVRQEGDELAQACFEDTLNVFTEHADEAGLSLMPGHAYFLDPRPDLPKADLHARITRRLRYELLPLLRSYVDERLLGPATSEVEGLGDRIEARLIEAGA